MSGKHYRRVFISHNWDDRFDQLARDFRIWERMESEQPNAEELKWKGFHIALPVPLLETLDKECAQRGVPRQTMVKVIIFDWLQEQMERRSGFLDWLEKAGQGGEPGETLALPEGSGSDRARSGSTFVRSESDRRAGVSSDQPSSNRSRRRGRRRRTEAGP